MTVALRRSERGVVAIVAAVAMMTLLIAGAAAVDIAQAIYVRNSLQITVDSGLKAAAAAALTQPLDYTSAQKRADSERIVKAYIKSNNSLSSKLVTFDLENGKDLQVQYVDSGADEDTIQATLNATILLNFTKILLPSVPATITGRIKRPRPVPLELALALDVTNSMSQTLSGGRVKMAELKDAAISLTDFVLKSDYSKVGIVPFAQQVNIGTNYKDPVTDTWPAWLDPKSNTYYDQPPCTSTNCQTYWGSCRQADGTSYGCWVKQCDTVCQNYRIVDFGGCIPARGKYINKVWTPVEDISSPTNPKYVGQGVICQVPEFTDLTAKADFNGTGATYIRSRIDALTYVTNANQGNTFIPVGLTWGWNMLEKSDPLNRGSAFNAAVPGAPPNSPQKVIVLITDGDNWWTPTGPGNGGTAGASPIADALTLKTCTNAKNAKIRIITVALAIDTATTVDMLKQCASSSDDFYFVQNTSDLQKAFQEIGMSFAYSSLKE